MESFTVKDICEATGGKLGWGDPAGVCDGGVFTDSRETGKGCVFVAIVGARVDGHDFIPDVLSRGAACVIATEPKDGVDTSVGACVYVEDTLAALQKLAAWYRRRFDIPVIGVTGSVGKTSTKEMIGAVLSKKYKTLITYKNMNSQVGLALMMFHLDSTIEMAVFEMGVSIPGEMDRLVDIAAPSAAVITNIGVSHIGNMGSRENICKEKGRIIRKFGDKGRLFACGNADLYDMITNNLPYDCCDGHCGTFFYGIESDFKEDISKLSFMAKDIYADETGEHFTFVYPSGEAKVRLSVMGEHNVTNSLSALAIGLEYGVDLADAIEAVGEYMPLDMRGVLKSYGGASFIDDTYNASPDSIRSNIRAMFSYPGDKRRIAVLGDVLELGEKSSELHKSIGAFIESEAAAGRRLDALYTVGNESEIIVKYLNEHTDIPAKSCKDNFELINSLAEEIKDGDRVLFKGSRGMHLDEVVEALLRRQPDEA